MFFVVLYILLWWYFLGIWKRLIMEILCLKESLDSVGFLNKELLLFKERIRDVLKLFFSNFFNLFILYFVKVLIINGMGIFGNIKLMDVLSFFLFL